MNIAFLLLGGNLGDVEQRFRSAYKIIEKNAGKILSFSSVYETEPWGFEAKTNFLNQVIKIETTLNSNELLNVIQKAESMLGRERESKEYTSRKIDIDILFFNDQVIHTQNLIIPHPKLHERKFTLVPLFEIAPDLFHPQLKKSISTLVDECTDRQYVKVFA